MLLLSDTVQWVVRAREGHNVLIQVNVGDSIQNTDVKKRVTQRGLCWLTADTTCNDMGALLRCATWHT